MTGVPLNVDYYLETILPMKIIANNDELKNCGIIECTATNSKSLDGFLSTIFQVRLTLKDNVSGREQTLNLIAKLLRHIENFREDAKLDEMTFNELAFYKDIMPVYKRMLNDVGIKSDWTPKFYYGFYGFDKELGDGKNPEGVFVFENLTADGCRLGPREMLDEKHILIMTESIAKLHATSYALKIQSREKFDEFVDSFQAFPFKDEKKSMFDALYAIALERLHQHVTSTKQADVYSAAVREVYEKYIEKPSGLLQEFLDDDPVFNTIIHGDYNRNNVMFKYASAEGFEDPIGLKMFDFQWIKYASPVLDLSFYLYMNLDPAILESSWSTILKFYHETLISSLAKLLKCNTNDERLANYNFESFLRHFANFAFYGCLISTWFLPIMLADLETCKNIEAELNKDLFSQESKKICLTAGGESAIERVNGNVMHAFKNGYMRRLLE